MQRMKKTFTYFVLLSFVSVYQVFSQSGYPASYDSSDQPASSVSDTGTYQVSDSSATTGDTDFGQSPPPAEAPESSITEVNTELPSQPAPLPSTAETTETAAAPAAQPSAPLPVTEKTPSGNESFFVKGIGFQSGVRFHDPDVFNAFVTDLWNSCIEDYIYLPADDKNIGPGVFLTLNGSFDFGRYFQVSPFMQGMMASKWFYFRGGITKDLFVNTYTAMGGINLWGRLAFNRFAVRMGAGGYGAYTIVRFTGDIKKQRLKGKGYGFRALAGGTLRLNRHFVLTLDCAMPFGVSTFDDGGSLKTDGSSVSYPTEMEHGGFEILPGVQYYF